MKHIIIISVILAITQVTMAQQKTNTVTTIRNTWSGKTIRLEPSDKEKTGIEAFARAVCLQYQGNTITDAVLANLNNPSLKDEDYDFTLSHSNGYIGIRFVSDGTVEGQMCYWGMKNKHRLVAVKLFNVYEDPLPLLMFYDYDPDTRVMQPMNPAPFDIQPDLSNCDPMLPEQGKNIKLMNYDPVGESHLLYDGDGHFTTSSKPEEITENGSEPATVTCFLSDGDVNFRNKPNGTVVAKLPSADGCLITVHKPENGWWRVLGNTAILPDSIVNITTAETECWVHYSVIGETTRLHDLKLYSNPDTNSTVIATIRNEDALVNPISVSQDGTWQKVRFGKSTGWIESEGLCGNPFTTCP